MYEGVYSNDPAEDELAIEYWGRFDAVSERFAGMAETGDDYEPSEEELIEMFSQDGLCSCIVCHHLAATCSCALSTFPDDIPF